MKGTCLAFLMGASVLAGCSSTNSSGFDMGSAPGEDSSAGEAPPAMGPGSSSSGSSGAPAPGQGGTPGEPTQSGQLTAGVWDDNLNFDWFKKYEGTASKVAGAPTFSLAEREIARDAALAPRSGVSELDLAFLIDTTGSMGDELSYLQSEIDSIAQMLSTKFPQTVPRFGLVVYRDHGDQYVTRVSDFQGLAGFREKLRVESAGGGGDLPEAVPEGLEQTVALGWRTGSVARVAFWVADAPHHDRDQQKVRSAIDVAVQKRIHLYPVAASGVDPLAEYTMRSAAQLTGGRYVFLTDDSGIGNSHAEPHIPCYHVTRFDNALVRVVSSEMTGTHVQPAPSEIIRSVGNPKDGKCTTSSQGEVVIY